MAVLGPNFGSFAVVVAIAPALVVVVAEAAAETEAVVASVTRAPEAVVAVSLPVAEFEVVFVVAVVLVLVVVVVVAVGSLNLATHNCFAHVENSLHLAMKTMDSKRLTVVVDHLNGIPFVFSIVDHCTAFAVTMKIESLYGPAQVHCTVEHLLEIPNCIPIRLA